ncbi:uncharacterized protein [Mytilus edulis]|uniref:uncharacterized protein n=1 Tax=Mytilus edulis TaxID=6550 RepID=UPI0039F10DF5
MDNVIKQGYLKKSRPTAPGSNPANSFLQLFEPTRWFVFGLRIRRPYLEYYEKEQHVFTAQPINNFDLYECTKVTYTLGRNNRNWTFCLFLQDRVLELTADSREVMLSWCRTLEHTLQNYGALKHVPSEHIYSDYPVRYKPKKSASPPPIEDRDSATPTPPPSEPAPPVPRENGLVPLQPRAGAEYCNSDWVGAEKPESEHSEPDTSEDDFVNEEFFKQKKLEAFTSNTLKPISKTENPFVLHSRSVASLPLRSFSLPAEYANDTPQLPARPHRNKPVTTGTSEPQYSQVNKLKPKPEPDSEDVYESAFDFDDQGTQCNHSNRNTLTDLSSYTTDELDEGVYEAAFDVCDTQPLFEKKNSDPIVELPKRKSKLKDIDELSSEKRKSQIAIEENIYSGFNCGEEQIDDGKCVDKKADLANNNIKNENIYSNTNSKDIPVSKGLWKDNTSQNQNKDHIYSNTNACINAEATSKETTINDEESQGTASPVKPPRRNSRNASKKKVDPGYANFDKAGNNNSKKVAEKHEKTVETVPLPVRPQPVKENIYDFGKCLPPPVNKSEISKADLYSNLNSLQEQSRGSADLKLSSKYTIPPPLNLNFDHARSDSSSPETPRKLIESLKMPSKFEPVSTKNDLEDLPPSPTSPTTPVNNPGIDFPTVHKSVINVTDMSHKKQSSPSPKPRHSRTTSHSPKIRHSDDTVKEAPNVLLPKSRLASGKQERPRSLIMPQQYDYMSSVHQPVRKNTGEALYSPVLNKKWFGSQPMPGISSQPKAVVASQPILNLGSSIGSQPVSKNGFQPISTETDEIYQVPKRARSVKVKHEPQPTFISRDIESSALGSSPSHDGFQFNVPKRQTSAEDNEDDEDNDSHDYEDATMRHGEPPLPPRRTNAAALNNRSQSVYVPCNINPEASNKVIVRQTSLRERQRITSAPGLVTVLPLKQSEIDILQEEQQSHGIIVKISPAACQKIALVDSFNGVWIIGWDFKHYPRLSESIHIGDEVTKINDLRVTNANMAKKVLKSCNTEQIDLVIKRLPYAKVMAIRRHQTGENLGLQRLGGTAEITYVDPSGLTAQHGLTKHASCVESEGTCNWWITEINNRPLNLSFKGNEIEAKLNAVGKDISIVVHPSDFIKELKRQLKKMRNFKDFMAVA